MECGVNDHGLLNRLFAYLSVAEHGAVRQLADRLLTQYGAAGIANTRMLVAYGGGKDSTYTVAFLRTVQLYLLVHHGVTFTLRSATMRHAGVPKVVMENIDRVYRRLGLIEDDRSELIVVDQTTVRPFDVNLPFPEDLRELNRTDILLNGHLTGGDGRPTFCNACNLSVANFFGRAAWWNGGVDAIFTGDSAEEQHSYSMWILRLARRTGIDTTTVREAGFHGLLRVLNQIGRHYYTEIFGAQQRGSIDQRSIYCGHAERIPDFISIYDLVDYHLDAHRDLVTTFLGFQLDELALSFTESDCANPAVMAHLRGLRAERLEGRSYAQGITEYLELARILMKKKQMPEDIQALILDRYATQSGIDSVRRRIGAFGEEAFGINEAQWVCVVFSPFVGQGERLNAWLEQEAPYLLPRASDIRRLLRAEASHDATLGAELEAVSGLCLANLRTLYNKDRVDFKRPDSLISRIREGDPHKALIHIRDRQGRRLGSEVISGR